MDYKFMANAQQNMGPKIYAGDLQGNSLATPQDRTPQVAVQMEILSKEVISQREAIARLADRMTPVLSLGAPCGTNNSNAQEPTCPVAFSLYTLVREVAANTSAIQSLLSRIEV